MPADDHKTFSMRVDAELLNRIDQNAAAHAGGNRTQYLLSWLPEAYDQPASDRETPAAKQRNNRR